MHKKNKRIIQQDPQYKLVSSPQGKNGKNVGKIKKLKMKNIVDQYNYNQQKQRQIVQFENDKIFTKLYEQKPQQKSKQLTRKSHSRRNVKQGYNQYLQIYRNDMKFYQQYIDSTQRYGEGGTNLKWPYYFGSNCQQ